MNEKLIKPVALTTTSGKKENLKVKYFVGSTLLLWFANILFPGTAFLRKNSRWFTKTFGILFILMFTAFYASLIFIYFNYGLKNIGLFTLSHPEIMNHISYGVYILAGLWIALILGGTIYLTHKVLWKAFYKGLLIFTTFILTLSIAGGAYWVSSTVIDIQETLEKISEEEANKPDIEKLSPEEINNAAKPWGDKQRVNMMILGSDQGNDRVGIRPDILMVASINTVTGSTQLFNIPRNLNNVRFPVDSPAYGVYPNGFDDLINAVWAWGDSRPDLYPNTSTPGLQATKEALNETLGLDINYYMVVNMQGFSDLVDSLGGVTVNVPRDIPKGQTGDVDPPVIPAGANQTLNGQDALWFVRSRSDSNDYDRILRQRCMISVLTQKLTGEQIVVSLPSILQNLRDNFSTDIRQENINDWADLFDKVQKRTIQGYAFTDEVIDISNPDWLYIKNVVQGSIDDETIPLTQTEKNGSFGDLKKPEVVTPPVGEVEQVNPYC